MNTKTKIAMLVAASGAVAATASAEPFAIYGGGATLQANFFQSPFASFDYIDVDADGWADSLGTTGAATGGLLIDQLVVNSPVEADLFKALSTPVLDGMGNPVAANISIDPITGIGGNSWAHLYYRRVGSGNGIAELLFKGRIPAVGADIDMNGELPYDSLRDDQDGDPYLNVMGDGSAGTNFLNTAFASEADFNRDLIIDNGSGLAGSLHNPANRGGVPYRMFTDNSYEVAQNTGPGDSNGTVLFDGFDVSTFPGLADDETGVRLSFSASDVPFSWFAQVPGMGGPATVPGAPGYGINPVEAVNPDGTPADRTNNLIDVAATGVNTNTASPDEATVFDTPLVLTPVAPIVNYGVGLEQIDMSDLRTLAATGRRVNGENLVKVTRDSGSGTRNAFMNGIGLDPAWGRGENVGIRNGDDATTGRLGPSWLPSNKNGSSRMEFAAQQHRLAVGHTGAERNGRWLDDNELEILAVRNDFVRGGAAPRGVSPDFVRPDLEACLDGGAFTGFIIIGPAAVSTIGDPRRAEPEFGGFGWNQAISGEDPMMRPANFEAFAPQNRAAAAFVNNITRSAEAFVSFAVDPSTPIEDQPIFTPGASLAFQFVPPQAAANVPVINPDPSNDTIPVEANGGFNNDLANFIRNLPGGFVNSLAAVGDFQSNQGGEIPFREAGVAYSEFTDPNALSNAAVSGSSGSYVTQDNTVVGYGVGITAGSPLMRNKIAGDFDGDEARTPADVPDMLEAYWDRIGGPNWVAPNGSGPNNSGANGGSAIIEVLGDFTGDGNFDAADVRYWGDGLHLTTTAAVDWNIDAGVDPTHNRVEGFTAIDDAAANLGINEFGAPARGVAVTGGGFFGVTLANPNATYDNGDSACDVAGSGFFTVGNNPIGWDRVVDAQDIDYVGANFGDFTDLDQAVFMDLSCDMNGDLQVDAADVNVIFACLETVRGDFDLDGDVDADDRAEVEDGMGDGYATGDFDLDGDVDADDLAAFNAEFGGGGCNAADLAEPFNSLDIADVVAFLQRFGQQDPAADLGAPQGDFDIADIVAFLQIFGAGCP